MGEAGNPGPPVSMIHLTFTLTFKRISFPQFQKIFNIYKYEFFQKKVFAQNDVAMFSHLKLKTMCPFVFTTIAVFINKV